MKSQRQAKIMEIISNQNVETQEQLLLLLQVLLLELKALQLQLVLHKQILMEKLEMDTFMMFNPLEIIMLKHTMQNLSPLSQRITCLWK